MSLIYSCGSCGQKWNESELDADGAVGELAWECPGCLSLQSLSNVSDDTDIIDEVEGLDGAADELSVFACAHCDQSWTESELEDEGSLTEWMWVCPGCHGFNKDD